MTRAILLLAVLLVAPQYSIDAAEPPASEVLFESGKEPFPRFRIPALILTPKGTLLAICEGRRDGGGLTGDIDMVLRRSKDLGKTWQPLEVIADEGKDTLGNPCPVIDQKTGTLWLLMTVSPGDVLEEEIVAGKTKESTRVLVMSSQDDGQTWTKPKDITSQAKQKDWTWYGTGPGVGIQLKSGRLLIPSYHAQQGTEVYSSHVLYSDDHGKSWQIGETLGEHCGESAALQRDDGSIYYSARTNNKAIKEERTIGESTDEGETFVSVRHDPKLYDSHCQASLLGVSSQLAKKVNGTAEESVRPLWLYCHPAGPGRQDLTFRISRDEGLTWPKATLFHLGNSQYSSMAELPDGTIGCLYESWQNENYQLFFARVPLNWVIKHASAD